MRRISESTMRRLKMIALRADSPDYAFRNALWNIQYHQNSIFRKIFRDLAKHLKYDDGFFQSAKKEIFGYTDEELKRYINIKELKKLIGGINDSRNRKQTL